MEYAKKLVLLPSESVEKISEMPTYNFKTVQTPGNEKSRLDTEMRDILDLKNMNDYDKWVLFQQLMQRFLHLDNVNQNEQTLDKTDEKQSKKDKTIKLYDHIMEILNHKSII